MGSNEKCFERARSNITCGISCLKPQVMAIWLSSILGDIKMQNVNVYYFLPQEK